MSEQLHSHSSSEITNSGEHVYSPETQKLWQEYQDGWTEYQNSYGSIEHDAKWYRSSECQQANKLWNDLKRQSVQVLRSLETPEQCAALQNELTERYTERVDNYGIRGQDLENLKKVAQNRKNYDPMLQYSAEQFRTVFYDEGGKTDNFKVPLRALVATLSPEERQACGVDAEEARVKKIEQGCADLLNTVPTEFFDAVKDCRDTLLEADTHYSGLRKAYATLALYTAPRDFNKKEIFHKLRRGAEYETVDLYWARLDDGVYDDLDDSDEDDGSRVETSDSDLADFDLVGDLPDKSTTEWVANSHAMYDGANQIMHTMHQIYPNLHSDAMEDYAKIVTALSFGTENAEKIYSDTFYIQATELGISGKEPVPQAIEDIIKNTLKHYNDLYLADLRMTWTYSHYDMGEDYDYSNGENIKYIIAGLNAKRIEHFYNEVQPLLDAKVAELAAEQRN